MQLKMDENRFKGEWTLQNFQNIFCISLLGLNLQYLRNPNHTAPQKTFDKINQMYFTLI